VATDFRLEYLHKKQKNSSPIGELTTPEGSREQKGLNFNYVMEIGSDLFSRFKFLLTKHCLLTTPRHAGFV
jgi:hypothetical protein